MAKHMGNASVTAGFSTLPPEFEPISSWGYVGYTALFNIPIVGLIFLIVFAVSGKNINRRNFARSYFCIALIVIAITVILTLVGIIPAATFTNALDQASSLVPALIR